MLSHYKHIFLSFNFKYWLLSNRYRGSLVLYLTSVSNRSDVLCDRLLHIRSHPSRTVFTLGTSGSTWLDCSTLSSLNLNNKTIAIHRCFMYLCEYCNTFISYLIGYMNIQIRFYLLSVISYVYIELIFYISIYVSL